MYVYTVHCMYSIYIVCIDYIIYIVYDCIHKCKLNLSANKDERCIYMLRHASVFETWIHFILRKMVHP